MRTRHQKFHNFGLRFLCSEVVSVKIGFLQREAVQVSVSVLQFPLFLGGRGGICRQNTSSSDSRVTRQKHAHRRETYVTLLHEKIYEREMRQEM